MTVSDNPTLTLRIDRFRSSVATSPAEVQYDNRVHLLLMRHGQSHVNLADLTKSHTDDPLTERGRRQAEAAAQYLSSEFEVTQIWTSSVSRAVETAQFAGQACDLPISSDDRLREIGTAHPGGLPMAEEDLQPYVQDMWGTQRPYEPVTADGESWMQFRSRIGSFLESIVPVRGRFGSHEDSDVHDDQVVLVVCHAGVIEAVFEYVFEKGPWSVVAIETSHTGLTHLQYSPRANMPDWWLHFHNRIVHLSADLL